MKTLETLFKGQVEGLLHKPITQSPLDLMHKYANVKDFTLLTQGGLGEFIIKTSLFVSIMFLLRIILGFGLSDVIALPVLALIIAVYCYSLRSYLNELVIAVSGRGLVGVASALSVFIALVGVALWV